ncbi:MAG TPA: Flp pilus assembly protein CpaB [Devosia sp.]
MKPTSIVLLLVALIAGGLAAFLATQQSGPVQVVEGPTTVVQEAKARILVAMAPIGVGQRLSPATVQWGDWPEGAVRDDYITIAERPEALSDITGAVARFEIFPGDPITEQKLVRTGQGYMSAVLDKGKRGVSVAVEAASASGGFIMPNDHVDVISSRQSATGLVSETILSNIKVLAIDARLGETGDTGAPPDPENPNAVFQSKAIATLELDPGQAEVVVNAAQVGTVSLSLRSIADFQGGPEAAAQRTSQNVRLIRFGEPTTVVAGRNETASAETSNADELSPATLSE